LLLASIPKAKAFDLDKRIEMSVSVDILHDIPDESRLWIVPADRLLTLDEQSEISSRLSSFFDGWHSHGRKVVAQSSIVHDQLIVVGAYVPGDHVYGCGIDASVHELEQIADVIGFARASVLDVFFSADNGVRNVSRPDFASLAKNGDVSKETIVFDTSLTSAGEWKSGSFSRPVSESWHANVFF
jgi:hypothetical protein